MGHWSSVLWMNLATGKRLCLRRTEWYQFMQIAIYTHASKRLHFRKIFFLLIQWYNCLFTGRVYLYFGPENYEYFFIDLFAEKRKSAIFLRTQDAGSSVLFRIIEFFLASLIPYFPFMHFSNNVVRMISPSSLNHRHLHCVPPFLFGRFYTLWPKNYSFWFHIFIVDMKTK